MAGNQRAADVTVDVTPMSQPGRAVVTGNEFGPTRTARPVAAAKSAAVPAGNATSAKIEWTTEVVEACIVQAMATLRRTPMPKEMAQLRGTVSAWPATASAAGDLFAEELADRTWERSAVVRPGPPSAQHISNLDRVLEWLTWIPDPIDRMVVVARASGAKWAAVRLRDPKKRCRLQLDKRRKIALTQILGYLVEKMQNGD